MALMRSHDVLPTPKIYALFFAHVSGQSPALSAELTPLLQQPQGIDDHKLDALYARHMVEPQQRAVSSAASSAKKILNDMMQTVAQFVGDTSEIGQDIGRQLAQLDTADNEEALRILADSLIVSAKVMQKSSVLMSGQLARAQQEISELRSDLGRLTIEAERDFLTGVYNRKSFDRRLVEMLDGAKQQRQQICLMMVDIDNFKRINDQFGHPIGDEVLKTVAKSMTDTLKGMDCIARYGGEEFAVILPNTPLAGGRVVAEAVRESIARRALQHKTSHQNYGSVTVSIGLATLHVEDSAATLIERADKALYAAKHAGRNRVCIESGGMSA